MTASFFGDDFQRWLREASGISKMTEEVRKSLGSIPMEVFRRDQDLLFSQMNEAITLPKFDFSEVYKSTLPVADIMKIAPLVDFRPPTVDFKLPNLPNWPQFELGLPDISEILANLAKRFPPNWPDELPDFEVVRDIVENNGIPLVYIPRSELVELLVTASDRESRVEILVRRTSDILDDCFEALKDPLHEKVDVQRTLITDAIDALRAGHTSSAQALAINVCDTLINAHINDSHNKAKNSCQVGDVDELWDSNRVKYAFGVAPVVNLLTTWHPKSGKPRPHALSRHVTVHQAHPDHYTPGNAIIAIMVASSLMMSLHEMYTEAAV